MIALNKVHSLLIILISLILFYLFSFIGFFIGREYSYSIMLESFGEPAGEQVFFFALVIGLSEILLALLSIPITFIAMHWLGKRLKISVAKPAFYGFLLYLLTLLTVILLYNRTH